LPADFDRAEPEPFRLVSSRRRFDDRVFERCVAIARLLPSVLVEAFPGLLLANHRRSTERIDGGYPLPDPRNGVGAGCNS